MRRPDESLCESLVEVQDEWRRHFAELEGGVPIDLHDLAQQCVLRQQHTPALEQVDWREIPDFEGVVRAFRQVKPLKAAGPGRSPAGDMQAFRMRSHDDDMASHLEDHILPGRAYRLQRWNIVPHSEGQYEQALLYLRPRYLGPAGAGQDSAQGHERACNSGL